MSIDPKTLNLRQLRTELKKLNLSPSGPKADLVKRLKEALTRIRKTNEKDEGNEQTKKLNKNKRKGIKRVAILLPEMTAPDTKKKKNFFQKEGKNQFFK